MTLEELLGYLSCYTTDGIIRCGMCNRDFDRGIIIIVVTPASMAAMAGLCDWCACRFQNYHSFMHGLFTGPSSRHPGEWFYSPLLHQVIRFQRHENN